MHLPKYFLLLLKTNAIMAKIESNIVKSPLIIQKEKELKELEARKKKVLTNLKRAKTTLENTKNQILDLQKTASNGVGNKLEDIESLKNEIFDLFDKVKNAKNISKKDKKEIAELKRLLKEGLEDSPIGDMTNSRQQAKRDFENDPEQEQQSHFKMFEGFFAPPSEQEQKDIRKLYILLAAQFHPDKSKSKEEEELFNKVMQKINDAYQKGDFEELLNIQKQYESYTNIADAPQNVDESLSFMDKEIERKAKEIALLESQVLRVKTEMENLKQSPLGEMLRFEKNSSRRGNGLGDMANQLEMMYQDFLNVKKGMEELLETGKIPEYLYAEPTESQNPFDILEELLNGKVQVSVRKSKKFTQEEQEIGDLLDAFLKDMGSKKKRKR